MFTLRIKGNPVIHFEADSTYTELPLDFRAVFHNWCATSCYQVCSEFLFETVLNISTFTAFDLLCAILKF
jgi:hypothetical protein